MRPKQKPRGLITLVDRSSTTLYSGMVPGLIAGLYSRDQVAIDLRRLAADAGVAFVEAEIQGINLTSKNLLLNKRLPLPFTQLSLDVKAISRPVAPHQSLSTSCLVPIKPLEPALALLESQDGNSSESFHVMGSGNGRGGGRPGPFHCAGRGAPSTCWHEWIALDRRLAKVSSEADVHIEHQTADAPASRPLATISAGLLCSGSRAPSWLVASGLPCCSQSGRVRTNNKLQVIDQPQIFASGDCAGD